MQLPAVAWSAVHGTFNTLGAPDSFADIANGKFPSVEEAIENARRWARRLGVSAEDGEAFVNGKWYEVGDNFLRDLQTEAVAQIQLLQELVSIFVLWILPVLLSDLAVLLCASFVYHCLCLRSTWKN
jgi:UDP-glucose:glycoprotein glucosyltransferase